LIDFHKFQVIQAHDDGIFSVCENDVKPALMMPLGFLLPSSGYVVIHQYTGLSCRQFSMT